MSLKEIINKLKKKIAVALGISIIAAGGVQINVNIQTQRFYEKLADGELYVNSFNMGAYKEVRSDLADQMAEYLAGGEPLTYQAVQAYLKVVSREAGQDSFEKEGKSVKGWNLKEVTTDNYLLKINNRLKTKIK